MAAWGWLQKKQEDEQKESALHPKSSDAMGPKLLSWPPSMPLPSASYVPSADYPAQI